MSACHDDVLLKEAVERFDGNLASQATMLRVGGDLRYNLNVKCHSFEPLWRRFVKVVQYCIPATVENSRHALVSAVDLTVTGTLHALCTALGGVGRQLETEVQ